MQVSLMGYIGLRQFYYVKGGSFLFEFSKKVLANGRKSLVELTVNIMPFST